MNDMYNKGFTDKCAERGVPIAWLKGVLKMAGYDTALGGTNVTGKAYVPPSKVKPAKPKADPSGKVGLENMYKKTYDKGKLPQGYRSPED